MKKLFALIGVLAFAFQLNAQDYNIEGVYVAYNTDNEKRTAVIEGTKLTLNENSSEYPPMTLDLNKGFGKDSVVKNYSDHDSSRWDIEDNGLKIRVVVRKFKEHKLLRFEAEKLDYNGGTFDVAFFQFVKIK